MTGPPGANFHQVEKFVDTGADRLVRIYQAKCPDRLGNDSFNPSTRVHTRAGVLEKHVNSSVAGSLPPCRRAWFSRIGFAYQLKCLALRYLKGHVLYGAQSLVRLPRHYACQHGFETYGCSCPTVRPGQDSFAWGLPDCPYTWHATRRSRISLDSRRMRSHASIWCGQRGWNAHPYGSDASLGVEPGNCARHSSF